MQVTKHATRLFNQRSLLDHQNNYHSLLKVMLSFDMLCYLTKSEPTRESKFLSLKVYHKEQKHVIMTPRE